MHIFRKTLKDEMLMTILFALFIGIVVYFVIQEFAVARHLDFSHIISQVPEPLKVIAERLLVLNIFGGYLHLVASVHWTIFTSFYVCILFSGLVAREIESCTLPILLAHPHSRIRVLLEKYAASALCLLFVVILSIAGFYIGIFHGFLEVPYQVYRLGIVGTNGFAFFLAVGSFAFLFSVIWKEYKRAAAASLAFFLFSYLIFFLGSFSPNWASLRQYTLFRFFDTEKLFMTTSFQWSNIISLLLISLIITTIAIALFQKKDIN